VGRRVVCYLTLSLPGWLAYAYDPRRGGGGVAWGQAGCPFCSYTGRPPYPRGGGLQSAGQVTEWKEEVLPRRGLAANCPGLAANCRNFISHLHLTLRKSNEPFFRLSLCQLSSTSTSTSSLGFLELFYNSPLSIFGHLS
jgi:hypothetical protein